MIAIGTSIGIELSAAALAHASQTLAAARAKHPVIRLLRVFYTAPSLSATTTHAQPSRVVA